MQMMLVELKRGKLNSDHEAQLQRYLDHARESPMLRACMDAGCKLRGVLATPENCVYKPRSKDIQVMIVDEKRVIQVLNKLRYERLKDFSG